MFGKPTPEDTEKMTAAICGLFERELGIPASAVYVTYEGISDWGWNGGNF